MVQTSQSQALGEFFHAYRLSPHQPLTLLCIALAYIQQAMTRKVDDRNRTVLQAFAFLQVSFCSTAVTPWISDSKAAHCCYDFLEIHDLLRASTYVGPALHSIPAEAARNCGFSFAMRTSCTG